MRFFRSSAALSPVTSRACADDIFPGRFSALASWYDVVQGRFFGGQLNVAILTPKAVSCHHVCPRKRGRAASSSKKSQQSHNGGRLYGHRNRTDVVIVLFDYLYLAHEEEADRVLPRDDPDRFVASAEK